MKLDNKPVFGIYNANDKIYEMCEYWNELAIQNGFDGINIIFQCGGRNDIPSQYLKYRYEPHASSWYDKSVMRKLADKAMKVLHCSPKTTLYDYDSIWKRLLGNARKGEDTAFYGAFAGYDDTPRRGKLGAKIVKGATPEKFERYFSELVKISASQNKEFVFLTAWNEWGEGAYIEPDTISGFSYLEAVKRSLVN
jgi:hypothetical protein